VSSEAPRMFALTRETDGPSDVIVGYGLELPDGSAYSISWPARQGASFFSTSSAEENAEVRGADLMWISDK
jgi:hypothetical protein